MTEHSGSLLHPLLHAGHLVEARLRDRLKQVGLRPRQARVLGALNRIGETHQKTLAAEFDITAASMSSMCNRLSDAGFIERHIDPNEKRAFLIRLTPKGKNTVQDVLMAWGDIDEIIKEALGHEAANALAKLSSKLRNRLGGRGPSFIMEEKHDA